MVKTEVDLNLHDCYLTARCRKPTVPMSRRLTWTYNMKEIAAVKEVKYFFPKYAENAMCIQGKREQQRGHRYSNYRNPYAGGGGRWAQLPEKLEVQQYAATLPGKVEKLLGVYIQMPNMFLYDMPVWRHKNGLAFIFYCKYYDKHDWRISQTLPGEHERAPARIRADQRDPCCPLDPSLFWESVDDQDHWCRERRSVNVVWYVEEPHLEPVCANVLKKLGLDPKDCDGWLSTTVNEPIQAGVEILNIVYSFFERQKFCPRSAYGRILKKAVGFPSEIVLQMKDLLMPPVAKSLLGTYVRTEILLYNIPVYKLVDGEGWLYYCRKYTNHDWRVGPSLPTEGARAPARIRAYSKNPCSPLEPGLFWEAVNFSNTWNTRQQAIVTTTFHKPHKEVVCNAILSSLGLPRPACEGWLAESTMEDTVQAVSYVQAFATLFRNLKSPETSRAHPRFTSTAPKKNLLKTERKRSPFRTILRNTNSVHSLQR